MKRIQAFCTLIIAGALACGAAFAQSYPSKVVRITSPYPTGISPDISMRVIADKLSRYWGQQVIVDARPGANGYIAFNAVKKAPADGHELLLVGNSHITINPALLKDVPYDPEADFAPVGLTYRAPFFLWVSTSSPYRTVGEMVAAGRKDASKIIYGTPYVGSPPHLGGAMLAQMTGATMLAVHYKEASQMMSSVVNGDIAFTIASTGSAVALVKAGRLRALAIASLQRSPDAPDVPTVAEAGGPAGYEVDTWVGILAPRGTPADILGRIAADLNRAMAEPDVRERHRALGVSLVNASPADMASVIRTDLRKNVDVVKRVGITPE
jgi:tripartite-type tricarboxylate transporter receptor subunit TctC